MSRSLFALSAGVSIILLAAVLCLFERTRRTYDQAFAYRFSDTGARLDSTMWGVESSRFGAAVVRSRGVFENPADVASLRGRPRPPPFEREQYPAGTPAVQFSFCFPLISQRRLGFVLDRKVHGVPAEVGGWYSETTVLVPYWFLLVSTSILPAVAVLRLGRYLWRRQRQRRGLCPRCGYDLSATPGRCPECGTVPAGGEGAT
jgi:hypothetical protein